MLRLSKRRTERLAARLIARALSRPPDFIVGGRLDPYLLRWYLTPWRHWHRQAAECPTPWNRVKGWLGFVLPSVYLHCFMRSDDDLALHDHPWWWCSILLRGRYVEHTIKRGGINVRRERRTGSVKISGPWRAHRVELVDGHCWTLFIIGPRVRNWGFHCPRGWVPWQQFTAADDPGSIGRGCGEG